MTDLPAGVREPARRRRCCRRCSPRCARCETDAGTTRKTLWRLHDGALVESVLMRYPARADRRERITVCISSQAGCGMACPFCATGQGGLTRNLSTAEIVDQVARPRPRRGRGELGGGPGRLSNVVFMGMGEPLANYNRVVAALHRLIDPAPDGFGLSRRSITVSTVGLVPAIDQLADEDLDVTLAVSLHAPDDELRDTLVPVNTRWKVAEVLAAADALRRAHRPPLLDRVRDDPRRQRPALAGRPARRPARAAARARQPHPAQPDARARSGTPRPSRSSASSSRRLEARGVSVTVRDTRGREIDGACGQLAATG